MSKWHKMVGAALVLGFAVIGAAHTRAGRSARDQNQVHTRLEDPGPSCLVLLGQGEGLLQGGKSRCQHRSGRRRSRNGNPHPVRRLRCRFRRHQRDHPERGDKTRRGADHGLHDLQQGAVRTADQGQWTYQIAEGPARHQNRRAGRRRGAQAVASARQEQPDRLCEPQHYPGRAEPSGADIAARARWTRSPCSVPPAI